MDVLEIKRRIKTLRKECDDKKNERKILATEYEAQKEIVKKSGVIALLTVLINYVILVPLSKDISHASMAGLGRFLSPFMLFAFIICFVIFLMRGYDLFINMDTKYSRKLAAKVGKELMCDEIKLLNEAITMMDSEIARLENELYESGENFEIEDDAVAELPSINPIIKKAEKQEQKKVEKTVIKKETDKKQPEKKQPEKKQPKKESVSDIFSGLDELILDEDDDFESSSDMWASDAMKRYR